MQVLALSTKMRLHTHTTVSVSSVEEQVNKYNLSMHIHNFDIFYLACVRNFLTSYPSNFKPCHFVLVCNTVSQYIYMLTRKYYSCV